jgi:hypothetical protein
VLDIPKQEKKPYTHAVVQYSIKPFAFIKKFDKIVDGVKELGLDQAKISAVCMGKDRRKSTGGFGFCYVENWEAVKEKYAANAWFPCGNFVASHETKLTAIDNGEQLSIYYDHKCM